VHLENSYSKAVKGKLAVLWSFF